MTSARLPLFPLGLVLFPGVPVPLHLFEPRYRQLLEDVRGTDKRFGIICAMAGVPERQLPAGRAGCVAEITDIEMMPDGRSNIVVVGRERFALQHIVADEAPYLVGEVTLLPDVADSSPVMVAVLADEVSTHFRRVVRAVQTLNDDPGAGLPALPDDSAQLAWTIASMIDVDLEARQRLLAERSPSKRLEQMNAVLRNALPDLELRAAMHGRESR
jgi:Lon protease-like protein